jgi:F0F1-type ATP synthase delta subunit
VFTSIQTKSQLVVLRDQLDKLHRAIFEYQLNSINEFDKFITPENVNDLVDFCRLANLDLNNQKLWPKIIIAFKNALLQQPSLKIIVARELPLLTNKKIAEWTETNLKQKYILDIEVDETLIGGLIIVKNGTFYDLSIRKQLEDIFDNNPDNA